MRDPFWQSARVLLRYKRQLSVAFVGAVVSATCFGAGLGMLLPTLHLLLQKRADLRQLILDYVADADRPQAVRDAGNWLAAHVPADPFQAFLLVMVIIAGLSIVGSVGRYVHELITITVVNRAAMVWRARLFRRLIHAPLIQVLRTGSADHISRITVDVIVMMQGHLAILGKTIAEVLKGAAALTLALIVNWQLTLVALVGAPVIGVLLRRFGKRVRRASKRALRQRGHMIATLKEALGGMRVVKVHNAEGYERRRFTRINKALFREEMKMRQVKAMASPIIDTLALIGVAAVASIAAWFIFRQNVPAAQFMTVLFALGAAGMSLKPLTNLHTQVQEATAAAGRVMELVDLPVEPTGPDAPRIAPLLPPHHASVCFDHISFAYPSQDRPAVDDVCLDVRHGQTVAIVGANGSGKTTLVSMLPRLIEPGSGRVLIDGVDIATVSLRSLRRQIAVVTQQTVLFEGTIAQNIAYGRRHEQHDRIIAAARAAHADRFITATPDGYGTMLAEDGAGLSGGQMQRIAIARAILRDPSILILDEATSQIDAESESEINKALRNFRTGRTVFVIAHRLSTVIDADRIVVMADGRIVDQGTHDELLKRCDIYQTLTRTQLRPPAA